MADYSLNNRKYVLGASVALIIVVYLIRLFTLQLMSDIYKDRADSNAFLRRIQFPARGSISDRNGKLLVFNQPAYDIMVVMKEQEGVDTLSLCQSLGITPEWYVQRMEEIRKMKGYSPLTQQLFMSQLSAQESSDFQEKHTLYHGFSIQKRSIREYTGPWAAHLLGDVGEVSPSEIERDDYYRSGDYIGKQGVERSYEKQLRGIKGSEILLRDVHGRIKGKYQNGRYDVLPIPGKNLTLSIDLELQKLGERLMQGKLGAIVAIEPATGEVLCLVTSPTFDPRDMTGRQRGQHFAALARAPHTPLLNRAIQGTYPPGSTFKTSQALTFLEEGIITKETRYPCNHGFHYGGLKVGCHGHPSPLDLVPSIATSCNGYFCWGLHAMLDNRSKYPTVQDAMSTWRDYMVSMGFGYPLGIDLPGEKRGLIPNAEFYNSKLHDRNGRPRWNGLSVISISIGQGEVTLTPLQICNLAATIANRGWFITPHVVHAIQDGELDPQYSKRRYTDVSPTHYETVVQGMERAVLGGTCRSAYTPNYVTCGKTGTAQNLGHDHSVFMGFAPKDNPRIAVAVYVENGGWGATFGVPFGALIIEQYINGHLSEASEQRAQALINKPISYAPLRSRSLPKD